VAVHQAERLIERRACTRWENHIGKRAVGGDCFNGSPSAKSSCE
jgi:hypothetical protein